MPEEPAIAGSFLSRFGGNGNERHELVAKPQFDAGILVHHGLATRSRLAASNA